MSSTSINEIVGQTFLDLANALETGKFGKRIKIGVTNIGSEHGPMNSVRGAEEISLKNPNIEVIVIGEKTDTKLQTIEADCYDLSHKIMEDMIKSGELDACVTMHYNFPIGVSTVGRVVSPANGKQIYIATTTGTSDTDRTSAMFKNAIYGIIAAKSCGLKEPTVGILNLDSARAVERGLGDLSKGGYKINFGSSQRADGGTVLRGNDLITGSTDVVVCDSLTGNILIKLFSSFMTGGSYESLGAAYGPGIGFGYKMPVFIISRASGASVIANAIQYAYEYISGNYATVLDAEEKSAKSAGYDKILEGLKPKAVSTSKPAVMPDKEVVTAEISGIEVMDLDAAAELLMTNGIYAEAGMGCTGPIILVNDTNKEKAKGILQKGKFIS